jgi:7,8-dihydropterin-6-yl-methyl-4-(beta-D-ribofuranosyl)aminobenzene 5'-phosphate synthase
MMIVHKAARKKYGYSAFIFSTKKTMKLTVLVDNNTLIDRYFYGEPAVSYLIEDEGKKVLFDVGYSDVFITNAWKMQIDLLEVDMVALSHGHLDHTWGLAPLVRLHAQAVLEKQRTKKPQLIAHPSALHSKTIDDIPEAGAIFGKEKLSRHFELCFAKQPVWLTERLVFLGEIDRKNDFEAQAPLGKVFKDGVAEDDYLFDDTALAFKSSEGLVIITACSHSGICNIIEYAKTVCGESRVVDVIGGFHLLNPPEKQLRGTLQYMKALKPRRVHACHCTDLRSKCELVKVVDLQEVGVGLMLEY